MACSAHRLHRRAAQCPVAPRGSAEAGAPTSHAKEVPRADRWSCGLLRDADAVQQCSCPRSVAGVQKCISRRNSNVVDLQLPRIRRQNPPHRSAVPRPTYELARRLQQTSWCPCHHDTTQRNCCQIPPWRSPPTPEPAPSFPGCCACCPARRGSFAAVYPRRKRGTGARSSSRDPGSARTEHQSRYNQQTWHWC